MEDLVIYSSFNHYSIRKIKEIAPQAETAYLYSDVILQIDKYAKNEGVNGLHPAVYHVKMAHFLEEYLQSGLKVRVWTVNQESDMKMLIDSGITAIITNYPDKARMIRWLEVQKNFWVMQKLKVCEKLILWINYQVRIIKVVETTAYYKG